ncbi:MULTISPECIES: tRNA (guanosine(46)-N7)-methyltransferase TrmB [Clostridium]|uniref:tRNA (guanine-N(7)-)-methyltransferase n=2 Tax=Clostridium TaxID=1485 RepID=D8GPD6_CLOLD|nr:MULTISPECIES: tRNA (guanosine(46)-N7)-methyltransferase TrmB [Clostridium]ADK16014.1 tRNA (guanine-N(7)-)-methyltransferase [Clostridium ljungdahlii DSM 13528]AGY75189.1 tRNA (guanosine(46)-N7)-methyltransferase TrmB [Clostridium autoethanogenum DSM 10061]ALU35360.1 TRNA (guanine-N(7)-)-methyltransferase [Clostridium autoethanogenum DSM 10061]OAA87110.1 tRNA (guanine-N(7)-)-methyltransferase [Clostridium ljungdahlii DSM 13528]OVY49561.1 tRNA (guanine-N(7)-)-methyltransferase [Clostridium au
MRLRKKWWARPEMEASSLTITEPQKYKGKWKEEFKNQNDIYLELGCGRGKFLYTQALNNTNINYIGIDLKDEVLIYALKKLQEAEVTNARIMPMNIAQIEEVFDKDEISRIYINFCNPWPKRRQKKRRLTHTVFLNRYRKFLKLGSEIWFKTDDRELFEESQEYFKENDFEIKYLTYDLHSSDFAENVVTEYEEKFTSLGMKTMFLIAKML